MRLKRSDGRMEIGFESLLMSEEARFEVADVGSWYVAELFLLLDGPAALSDRVVDYRWMYSEFPRRTFDLYVMVTRKTSSDSTGSMFERHRILAFETDTFRLVLRDIARKI